MKGKKDERTAERYSGIENADATANVNAENEEITGAL
jgi:hypothetical protein